MKRSGHRYLLDIIYPFPSLAPVKIMDKNLQPFELAGNNVDAAKNATKNDQDMASKKCNQCGFASRYASALRAHLKAHSGEKPNKCNQCDYASSHGNVLRIHLKKTQWRQVDQVPTV